MRTKVKLFGRKERKGRKDDSRVEHVERVEGKRLR